MNSVKLSHRKRFLAAVIVLSLFIGIVLLASLVQEVAASTTHEVKIIDLAFVPQNLTISLGDTILWNNTDQVIHTLWFVYVANESTYLLSDPIPPDTTWMHTFSEVVELQYYSFDMLWITGFISVTGDIPDIAVTDLTICYGQTVVPQSEGLTWINVTVANEGQTNETFTLTVHWNTTNVIGSTSVTLLTGETKDIKFTWDTSTLQRYVNYTLSAHATPVPGETDTTDNTYVDDTVILVVQGDVDGDKDVDLYDAVKLLKCYGAKEGSPNYDPDCDIDNDGDVDLYDAVRLLLRYGYKEP